MHPITEQVENLEKEKSELEYRISSIIHEIDDIQKNCNHLDENNNTTFDQYAYTGLNYLYECSICKKKTNKRPQ